MEIFIFNYRLIYRMLVYIPENNYSGVVISNG